MNNTTHNLIYSVIAAAVFLGCSENHKTASSEFTLSGQVTGFTDSSWIYLQTASGSGKSLDSAMVVDERFTMAGSVPDSIRALQVVLTTKNHSDYKFFWVENSSITFKGERGKFREAKVSGSATQVEYDQLAKSQLPFDRKIDSLGTIARDPAFDPNGMKSIRDSISKLFERRNDMSIRFAEANPGSLVTVNLLSTMASSWGREKSLALYHAMSDENKRSSEGKNVKRYLDLNKNPKVGEKYVDFEEPGPDNVRIKLSSIEAKVVLLEFWASWCGPCRAENPSLVATYKQFKDKGFEIYAVSLDDQRAHWVQAIEKDGLTWRHVSELKGPNGTGSLVYGINAIPDNFLIDSNGVVIARNVRGEELKDKLSKIL